jgi:hypothetical protein
MRKPLVTVFFGNPPPGFNPEKVRRAWEEIHVFITGASMLLKKLKEMTTTCQKGNLLIYLEKIQI